MPITKEDESIIFGPGPGITPEEERIIFGITPKGDGGATPSDQKTAPAVTPSFIQQLLNTPGAVMPGDEPALIELATQEELQKPHWLSRLLGISQFQETMETDSTVQMLLEEADRIEVESQRLNPLMRQFALQEAGRMRETASNIGLGNMAFSIVDFEERPRKILFNLMGLKAQHNLDKIREPGTEHLPLTSKDYRRAVSDGLDGVTYMPATAAIGGAIDPKGELAYRRFLDRHDNVKKVMTVAEGISNFGIAIGTEIGIAKAASAARKGVFKATKVSKLFTKFIPDVKATDTISDIIAETTERIAKDAGAADPVDGLIRAMQNDPDRMDEILHSYSTFFSLDIPDAGSVDDVLKGLIYQKWLKAQIKSVDNVEGIISEGTLKQLTDTMTIGKKKLYTELSVNELEDLALEVQSIKDAPAKFRNGMLAQINRKTTGPPVNTFARLGMERQYSRMTDVLYDKKIWYNNRRFWEMDAKRQFKKTFGKTWEADNAVDHAMGRIANGVPVEDWPDELRKAVTPEEIAWLGIRVQEDRDLFWEPLADIAEQMGLISTDPLLIAKGIPERKGIYYHWIHEKLVGLIKWRKRVAAAEGRNISMPPDYDLDKILKKKPPTGVNVGEFIAREAGPDDISYDWTRVTDIASRDELSKLLLEPEFKRFEAAVNALPATIDEPLRGTARESLRNWLIQARDMPADIDVNLNRAFNAFSKKMEKIVPGWESQERSFQHFAGWMSKRIDQGLLAANPRPTIRNMFQSMLASNIYGHRATLWGFQQLLTPGGRRLLGTSKAYIGRGIPVAAFDITDPVKWQRLTYLGITSTDKYLNVSTSYLSGWNYYFRRNKRAWNELVDFAKGRDIPEGALRQGNTFSNTLADAINAGKFAEARTTIDMRGIALTQWQYDKFAMSPLLRSHFGKLGLKYTSWPQYMWGAHMPQLWDQLRTGQDIFGMKASPAVRYAFVGMIAKGALLYQLGEQLGVTMEHLALTGSMPSGYLMGQEVPFPVSPAFGGAVGLGATGVGLSKGLLQAIGTMNIGALTEDNRMLDRGIDQLMYSMKTMIPLYGVGRQVQKVRKGEQPPLGIFWPLKKEKKAKPSVWGPGGYTPTIPFQRP